MSTFQPLPPSIAMATLEREVDDFDYDLWIETVRDEIPEMEPMELPPYEPVVCEEDWGEEEELQEM